MTSTKSVSYTHLDVYKRQAYQYQGQFFQLSDVLGVDKEIGFTLSHDKYNEVNSHHFLLEDIDGHIDFGEGMNGIYAHGENYQILNQHHRCV